MKTRRVLQKVEKISKYDLPASLNRGIGQVIVRWAYYEQHIQFLIWAVTFSEDNPPRGLARTAIRETRPEDQLKFLQQVAVLRNIEMDDALVASMKRRAIGLIEKRNLYAHGIWTDPSPGEWAVQQTRGSWEESEEGPSGNKKVVPEGIPTTSEDLKTTVRELDELIADAKKLKLSLGYKQP